MRTFTVLLFLSLVLGFPGARPAAAAGPVTLAVDRADSPAVVRGTYTGQPLTLSRQVRLTARGRDLAEVQLLASDLVYVADPTVTIPRSQVTIPAGTTLRDGIPQDVTVTITGLTHPGVYTGTLRFLGLPQARRETLPDATAPGSDTATITSGVPTTAEVSTELRVELVTPRLTTSPKEPDLTLRHVLSASPASVSGSILLTASGGDVENLQLRATNLRLADSQDVFLDRSKVTIPADTTLREGVPRDMTVTVAGVSQPGEYRGELTFLVPGQREADALKVPLVLTVDSVKLEPADA